MGCKQEMQVGLAKNMPVTLGACLSALFQSRKNEDCKVLELTVLPYAKSLMGSASK